jgi:hypothetical protein
LPKLGRLPNQGRPRVRLTADAIPEAQFNPPPAVDYYSQVPPQTWGMDGNDAVGDCTCAEVDHTTKARQIAAGNAEVQSRAAEVLAAYSAITGYNPNDPSTDQGAEMQAVRDYWRKHGVTLGGHPDKILMFAEIDHRNLLLVRWAVDRFGAVGLGFNFPASAMDQFNRGKPWTVVSGSPIDGGHAVTMAGYDAQYAYVITWGRVQRMDWAFFTAYVEEAWVDLDESFVNSVSGQDPFAETLHGLGEQFAQLTGQPNPVPVPAPTPTPPPAPTPNAFPSAQLEALRAAHEAWHPHHYSIPKFKAMDAATAEFLAAMDAYLMRG